MVPAGTLEFEHELAEVAPIPVLARFVRPDNRVFGQAEVRGGVPARKVVTASGVTAFLADRRDGVLDQLRAVHRADPGSGAGWSPVNSSTAFWDARRWPASGARGGHWSWERRLLVAERARPAVVALTARGGDLIRVIRGLG
jgi:hypothetical protein